MLAAVGVLVALSAIPLAWICFDNRPDAFIPAGHPALVRKELVEERFVSMKGDLARSVQIDCDAPFGGQDFDRAPAFGNEFVQIQIDRVQRVAAGIGAREDQHVADEAAEATRLIVHDGQRFPVLFFLAMFARQRDLRGRSDD